MFNVARRKTKKGNEKRKKKRENVIELGDTCGLVPYFCIFRPLSSPLFPPRARTLISPINKRIGKRESERGGKAQSQFSASDPHSATKDQHHSIPAPRPHLLQFGVVENVSKFCTRMHFPLQPLQCRICTTLISHVRISFRVSYPHCFPALRCTCSLRLAQMDPRPVDRPPESRCAEASQNQSESRVSSRRLSSRLPAWIVSSPFLSLVR